MQTVFDFSVKTANGEDLCLDAYRGSVLLVVNTASKCGFSAQYAGLEELHQAYGDRGLVVLGFPCNQFGAQEPEDDEGIQQFCLLTHGVSFPVLGKTLVNGGDAEPLFVFLRKSARGLLGTSSVKWNFTKFLVARDGVTVTRHSSATPPKMLVSEIEKLLG